MYERRKSRSVLFIVISCCETVEGKFWYYNMLCNTYTTNSVIIKSVVRRTVVLFNPPTVTL